MHGEPNLAESPGPGTKSAGQDVMKAPEQNARGRVDSLDGMRTLAVLAVMMVHSGFPGAELGWLGVDVFFVLSGFLITTLLCVEHRRNGTISLPKFWGRRFLRLMPAYFIYVATLTVWMVLRPKELSSASGWSPGGYIASLWGYCVNYFPKVGIWSHQYLTVHLWSLAVEEQFYFVWPFVAYFALRIRRPWVVGWIVVAAVLVRRAFATSSEMGELLSTRGIGIVLGCATAMTLATGTRPRWLRSARLRSFTVILTLSTIAVLAILHRHGALSEGEIKAEYVPLLATLFVAIVAMLWYGPEDRLTSFLSSRTMVFLGQISYGLYLYHVAAQLVVWNILTPGLASLNKYVKYGIRFSLYVGLTILIASASHRFVERRFLALKRRVR
jgi:peptidoglycan/LPS O-acetylase OafA/YrhL